MERPLIGLCLNHKRIIPLVTSRVKAFYEKHPEKQVDFIYFYPRNVNFQERTIYGFQFDRNESDWRLGKFPMPQSIYIQSLISPIWIEKLEEAIGPYVFNNFLFSKWEGHLFFQQQPIISSHLPETSLHTDTFTLMSALHRYREVILKPSIGSSSRGLLKIRYEKPGQYTLTKTTKEGLLAKEPYTSTTKFLERIHVETKNEAYIIQQKIQPLKYHNYAIDVRLNMNKNEQGLWEQSLMLLRVASNKEFLVPLALKQAFTFEQIHESNLFPHLDMKQIEKNILALGHAIGNHFDFHGYHMADLGIDFGIDQDGHIWIFEVNHIPYPTFGTVKDLSITRPLEYALFLAKMK